MFLSVYIFRYGIKSNWYRIDFMVYEKVAKIYKTKYTTQDNMLKFILKIVVIIINCIIICL